MRNAKELNLYATIPITKGYRVVKIAYNEREGLMMAKLERIKLVSDHTDEGEQGEALVDLFSAAKMYSQT
jgi:hypothetical protein